MKKQKCTNPDCELFHVKIINDINIAIDICPKCMAPLEVIE